MQHRKAQNVKYFIRNQIFIFFLLGYLYNLDKKKALNKSQCWPTVLRCSCYTQLLVIVDPSHRCHCLCLGDDCVFQTLLCRFDLRQQRPGELEALHCGRVQCMLGQPPPQRHQQGAVNLLEVCRQSLWAQYDLSAWEGALWHKQRANGIPQAQTFQVAKLPFYYFSVCGSVHVF